MTLELIRTVQRGDDRFGALVVAPGELGRRVEIRVDDRTRLELLVPEGIACGTRIRLRGHGEGGRGDLYIELHVADFLAP